MSARSTVTDAAAVPPLPVLSVLFDGTGSVSSDGKLGKIDYGSLDERYRAGRPLDAGSPPQQRT